MTDTIRDLLISLSLHMAYMQGQLEARHELDDFEDFYWYRESVLLRQKVTDALADEPAVPQPPAEGEVVEVVERLRTVVAAYKSCRNTDHIWSLSGNGVNARLTVTLLTRAAELLQQQHPTPVPVSERPWEREGWCDKRGMCWAWNWGICNWWEWVDSKLISYSSGDYTHCLPAHALPIPHQQEDHQ